MNRAKHTARQILLKLSLAAYFTFLFLLILSSVGNIKHRFDTGSLFLTGHEQECQAVDFVSGYMSSLIAKRCATKHDCFLYDTNVQFEMTNEILKPVSLAAPRIVEYPPYFYIFMYPLSFFSLKGAWLVWTACNLVLLITGLIYIGRQESFSPFSTALLLIWALSYGPVITCIKVGQMAIGLAAGLTMFWLLTEKRKYFAAGFATAFGIVKIQYLPFVVICGLVLGKKKYALGLAIAYVTLLIPCMLLFGPEAVLGYPRVLLHSDKSRWSTLEYMENIRGQIYAVFPILGTTTVLIIAACLMIAAMIAMVFIWRTYYRSLLFHNEHAFKICAAICTLMMLEFSLHTFAYDYVAAIVPCIWLYQWLSDNSRSPTGIYARCLKLVILLLPLLYLAFAVVQQSTGNFGFKFAFVLNTVLLILCFKVLLTSSTSKYVHEPAVQADQ